ncbi:hypothetical protein [Legionella fallonii]|uniref:Uncharacterized protein n=1 Tax=Legionella fallonii LLAP-10 TaxID=1212491 RepID=A0A098G8S9_9GAMM|nr:hypothetical protein [Legionella fallonii]CEG58404.1 conserved protein of unknown function [Legionella fallonii LLAP-10]
MISMTAYWEQFKECIDNLRASTQDEEYTKQIKTAIELSALGATIENLGLMEIKGITGELTAKSEQFGPAVTYGADKEYTFHLPKINTRENLIFAIVYYQHLSNYQNVSYQGSINWFRQMVIDGINEKKATMELKAKILLDAIRHYCQKQNITIDEALLLKNASESGKDYVARISEMVHKPEEPSNNIPSVLEEEVGYIPPVPTLVPVASNVLLAKKLATVVANPPHSDEIGLLGQSEQITTLEQSLEKLKDKRNSLKNKIDALEQKSSAFELATENHRILTDKWNNQFFLVRFFYWCISFFFEVTELKNLKEAETQLTQAEQDLNQLIPHHTTVSYNAKLQKQAKELKQEQVSLLGELHLEMQKEKQKEEMRRATELSALNTPPQVEPQLNIVPLSEPPHTNEISDISAPTSDTSSPIPIEVARQTSDTIPSIEVQPKTSDTLSLEQTSSKASETTSSSESSHTSYYEFFKRNIPSREVLVAAGVAAAAVVVQNFM